MASMTIRSSGWVLLDVLSIGDQRLGIHSDATVVKMEDGCMDQCKSMKIIVLTMGISATYHSYEAAPAVGQLTGYNHMTFLVGGWSASRDMATIIPLK